MYLTRDARQLAKELGLLSHDVGEGNIPLECVQAFRRNFWSVLDERTVVKSERPNILDRCLDLDTVDITSRGIPLGLLKDGRLWIDEMIASKGSVSRWMYCKRGKDGRVESIVWIDGGRAYELNDGLRIGNDFRVGQSKVVAADENGCVLWDERDRKIVRMPDGANISHLPEEFVPKDAITDPTRPLCVWGEKGDDTGAYVSRPNHSDTWCYLPPGETVLDVNVLNEHVVFVVKTASGMFAERYYSKYGGRGSAFMPAHDMPVEDITWLDGNTVVGRVNGRIFVHSLTDLPIKPGPFQGEVVQGPVRIDDGRVLFLVKRPGARSKPVLIVLSPLDYYGNHGNQWDPFMSLAVMTFADVAEILGGPYVRVSAEDSSLRIIQLMLTETTMTALQRENSTLEKFRVLGDRFHAVVANADGMRELVGRPSGNSGMTLSFSGTYKDIDIDNVVEIFHDDLTKRRLIANVQLEDGHWQVVDQNGPLGPVAQDIYGLRFTQDQGHGFIRWTVRVRRNLTDCTCRAYV
ncbi:MAG: hypothetical protein NUV56_04890 [Candidatus Uhrbacteria bacterium]|nr:hypothetical protein [Candidatus Uhrbacteria bacterium]